MSLSESARKYLGVPFRHRGRSTKALDCAGLLVVAARDLGREVLDLEVYGRDPWQDGLRNALIANLGQPVSRPPEVDDVLLIRLRPGAEPSHLGVVAAHPHGLGVIHTHASAGKVTFHRLVPSPRFQVVEVYPWHA